MIGRLIFGCTLAAGACLSSGCSSMSHTARGATVGGGIGAGTGAILGKAIDGKAGKGALIGGMIGAAAGGLIGNEEDQRERNELVQARNDAENRAAHAAVGSPMGIADVIQMSRDQHSDQVIINQMRSTRSTFQLSTEDVRMLKQNNVSDAVVMEMQNRRPETAARAAPPTIIHQRPVHVVQPRPVYVYEQPVIVAPLPPPPPPPGFGVGVHIRR